PRADIYSLGVVAYQLLSGRLPYEASSLSELAIKQQRESPPALERVNPQVSPELARAVMSALAIDQEFRPGDAVTFGEALRRGSAGVAPFATGATQLQRGAMSAADSAAATRVLAGARGEATSATRAATARAAAQRPTPPPNRQLEPRRAAPQAASAYGRHAEPYRERGRSGRGFRALIAMLILLCVLAAAVVIALSVATSTSQTALHIKHVLSSDWHQAVKDFHQLIGQNTTK
ncbi:MAG TPA: hypothetical protein VKT31_11790, partial [Solirubrobacteraceae bacterium]|nr:hypothetical protein [Solirubrobacteraceae bacterium]